MLEVHPGIGLLLSSFDHECGIGQVVCRRESAGSSDTEEFTLHHAADSEQSPEDLQTEDVTGLRKLAAHRADGGFRPIKAAPNLVQGWIFRTRSRQELHDALDALYPGFVADYWYLNQHGSEAAQHYRDFSGRQTGMYRVTQLITDEELRNVVEGCCDARFCLKSRQWTTAMTPADTPGQPSLIPCLEPCAPFLELARIQAKSGQSEQFAGRFSDRELDVLKSALEVAMENSPEDIREGEVYNIRNPRRIRILLAKLGHLQKIESEDHES